MNVMNRRCKSVLSVLLAVAMTVSGGGYTVLAEELSLPAWESEKDYPDDYYEEHILDYIDVDPGYEIESISDYGDDYVPALRGTSELPASYGYEDFKDYMPPLRDQNPFGSCWAHSALALAEISLKKTEL